MISIVIPVYKKVDEFIVKLNHNIKYFKDVEVIVVNDDPTASIKDRLFPKGESPSGRKNYNIQLIENSKNLGFGGTVDKGIRAAKNNFVFLLNSDVKLLDSSFHTALKGFGENEKIFGIAFAQKEADGSTVGKNKIFWKHGLLTHSKADNFNEGETGWVEGGSSIIRKDIYEKIGGFDTMFSPFYWEDIELSYRARKYGYISWFDPSVLVEHQHESTIGSFWSKRAISVIATRNQILCSWKFMSFGNLMPHILTLIYQALLSSVRGNFIFAEGLIRALPFLFSPKFYKIR